VITLDKPTSFIRKRSELKSGEWKAEDAGGCKQLRILFHGNFYYTVKTIIPG
jgi:hypothetical protein